MADNEDPKTTLGASAGSLSGCAVGNACAEAAFDGDASTAGAFATSNLDDVLCEDPDEGFFERRRAEVEAENLEVMREFEEWLAASGLSPKTVRRHVGNAWSYLDYLKGRSSLNEPTRAAEGAGLVDSYFSYDFIRDEYATPGMVGENVGSVKKLYAFMAETGRVGRGVYDELLDDIRTFKPGWLEIARSYQDWDPDSGEESPLTWW